MNIEEKNQNSESEVQSKTLMVLGLTFILPIVITLIAVYSML